VATATFKRARGAVASLSAMTASHLRTTPLLDFEHASIRRLVAARGWAALPAGERIGAVYTFVRDEIGFGYNAGDRIAASQVLADGYGQCNTKTTLLMALLRAVGVPCRIHGATIHKRLQKGVVTGLFYWLAPRSIIHSWAEVRLGDRWIALEGVIVDRRYLAGLRAHVADRRGAFLGYGVGTDNLGAPPIDWRGEDTAIQMTGIDADLGTCRARREPLRHQGLAVPPLDPPPDEPARRGDPRLRRRDPVRATSGGASRPGGCSVMFSVHRRFEYDCRS
jgi:hypothetical protein